MARNATFASLTLVAGCFTPIASADNPQGACCWPEPDLGMICQIMTAETCNQLGGYFYGVNIGCQDPMVECETATGACCVDDLAFGLHCLELTEADCLASGGYFYGAGTDCDDTFVECPVAPVDGACCFQDASGWQCMELEDYNCADLGGTWYGPGVSCNSPQVVCPPEDPIGACCADEDGDGQYWCLQLTVVDCSLANGYWYGAGIACSDPMVECEEPVDPRGACCADEDGDGQYWCVQLTLIDCSLANGWWYGPGVACGDPMVECESTPDLCDLEPGAMCAGRPNYADASFQTYFGDGDIAVETASPAITGGFVLTVFDLGDTAGAPTDSHFLLDRYSHASWTQNTLGSIFGLTVDGDGAIYVSATKSWYMDVMGPAGWGGVYRVDPVTSAVTTFAQLPNSGSSLGSITFDCEHDQFFVTNFEDGKVYRLDMNGNTLGTYDHGTPFNGSAPAQLGDRPFAVEVHGGRLYYSLWNDDQGSPSGTLANEIWSVELDFAGAPVASTALLEIELPTFYSHSWSSPVSDLRFTGEGTMLLAERSLTSIDFSGAHDARLFEYECQDGGWVQMPKTFEVGIIPNSVSGGVDFTSDRYWVSADAMHLGSPDTMYGMQGLPIAGGSTVDSLLVDYQDNLTNQDKTLLGDLVIIQGGPSDVACPEIWDLDIDCLGYNPPYDFEITLGVSNMDANETITHVQLTAPAGMTLTPSGFPMNLAPQHGWYVIPVLEGAYSGQELCLDALTTFHDGTTCETVICIELPSCNTLPADINADGVVNVDDLMVLLGTFGDACSGGCPADIDGDGEVTIDDLLVLVGAWS